MFLDTKLTHLLKVDSSSLELISSNSITGLNLEKVSNGIIPVLTSWQISL